MSQPKCPSCQVQGMEHMISKESRERSKKGHSWFYAVFCDQCGHVYGVFPKHVFNTAAVPQLSIPNFT